MGSAARCRSSGDEFVVADDDLEFLERISPSFHGRTYRVPPPTLAPELRAMRRMVWRNSNHLYKRRCAKTGTAVVSAYPAESPYPVYANDVWWGDDWDALASGREFDFRRPFFEQFGELMRRAPRPALMNRDSENSDYCNYAGQNKNCYMANNGSWYNENCLFGEAYLHSRDSVDCSYLQKSELCYEVMGGDGLYECTFVVDCHNSSNCHFSFNLRSCTDCFLCSNLRNKQGYIRNRPASKAELNAIREKLKSHRGLAELQADFARLQRDSLHPAVHQVNCEDSSGDYLVNCKNVQLSFMAGNIRDAKYIFHSDEAQDIRDCSLSGYGGSELYYETVSSGVGGARVLFCSGSWGSSDVLYCDTVMSCTNCFGCIGLKREEYCILNRRYSRTEYELLVPRIIEHMQRTDEWGEFFPENLAPHSYNESHAMDFYPLTKEYAQTLGYRWQSDPEGVQADIGTFPPATIEQCTEEICKATYSCQQTGKRYRIIARELALLTRLGIAPPLLAPEARRLRRLTLRNKPIFWERTCSLTGEPVMSTFAPDRPERVCSTESYLRNIYGED